ncbi:pirin family protein [Prosthecobacter debontii]|nr:pirin family protein [Prosthecobacter debontii]
MKPLKRIHHSTAMHWVGNGFPVRSVFDYNGLGRELSPFLLLDYAPPYDFPPGGAKEKRGVGAHPHKGFETVTVAYQGELEHRDSSGGGGKIGPGDVQWMTAGRGIVHEEFHSAAFTQKGGRLQMAQLWVNLRAVDKKAAPRYQTLLQKDIPTVTLPNEAGSLRVIAGDYSTTTGPAKTYSPIQLWDVSLKAGQDVTLPVPEGHTTAFLLLQGMVTIHGDADAKEGDLAIFERQGQSLTLHAKEEARLLLMAGEPLNEPIAGHGPFVMNTYEEIEAAFDEFQRGEMGGL